MSVKRFVAEWAALAGTAAACALVSNLLAAPQRKLDWAGRYPDATSVPAQASATAAPESRPPAAEPPQGSTPSGAAPQIRPTASAGAAPAPRKRIADAKTHSPTQASSPLPSPSPPPAAAVPAVASSGSAFAPHPKEPWVEISSEQVKELFDRGAPFFDARRTADYEAGHIAGARSIPVWEAGVEDKVKKIYQEGLDPSAPIVVYCSGGECEDSHMLAKKLWDIGLNNVLVYKGGFPDWQKRGWPVHQGPRP
jgi:rhodanese-related sulfurtransferase